MSKTQAKGAEISNDDLILHLGTTSRVITSAEGLIFGFLGSFIFEIPIALAFPILFQIPVIIVAGSIFFGTVGAFRNQIIRGMANRGLAWTYWVQRLLSGLFWVAAAMGIYAALSIKHLVPEYSESLSIMIGGLYFLLATPMFLFGDLMTEPKEGRLCLLQFLSNWDAGKPQNHTGHPWLRRGL